MLGTTAQPRTVDHQRRILLLDAALFEGLGRGGGRELAISRNLSGNA